MLDNYAPFDPSLIRNYHFVKNNDGHTFVQFVAIGDKHRMMKQDDETMVIIKESGKGKPYRYGEPYTIKQALEFLGQKSYPTHADIAKHITENAPA